jgi:SHS2 domain-containing protein
MLSLVAMLRRGVNHRDRRRNSTGLSQSAGHVTMIWQGSMAYGLARYDSSSRGSMPENPIEIIEHTADWSIRVTGDDLAQLFNHAATGMSMLMVGDLQSLPGEIERFVELDAYDAESLLVDWLSELAYWAETDQIVMSSFDLTDIDETHLVARVRGGQAPDLEMHIKAVTYHNLQIIRTDSGLEVTIVFDV